LKSKLLILSVILISLFLFSGCRWFADNPLFPRAKLMISAGPEKIGLNDDDNTMIRDVEFTFQPLNQVGAELTYCTIQYKTLGGELIEEVTRSIWVYVAVPPSLEEENSETKEIIKTKIEVLDIRTETYLRSQNITHAQAIVTFSGRDLAGHSVSFTKGIQVVLF